MLQPCLGESWSHTADTRLYMRREGGGAYTATLLKDSQFGISGSAGFRVSSLGIRDISN